MSDQTAPGGMMSQEITDDSKVALEGGECLEELESVAELAEEKGDVPLPENESVDPDVVVTYRAGLEEDQVREGVF